MVFKAYHLARVVISKTFPHGYGQTLIAATQSTSATHNSHFSSLSSNFAQLFGGNRTTAAAESAQNAAAIQSSSGYNSLRPTAGSDKKLDAYYAAWQQHQRGDERELQPIQFAKRLGWKAPTTIPDPQAIAKSSTKPTHTRQSQSRASIQRTKSTSALDDLRATSLVGEDRVVDIKESEQLLQDGQQAHEHALSGTNQVFIGENASPAQESDVSSAAVISPTSSVIETASGTQSTFATSVAEDAYAEQLAALAESSKHAEIPAVFETMLKSGISPSPAAYNALLLAAINLPHGKHQIVPRVLDVYSDMLRRRIVPDTSTYAILIEVLAARAMEVFSMQKDLLQSQRRYFSASAPEQFLLGSDETELKILLEDESLNLAIKLFDTSAASKTVHTFPMETYGLLISACAEQSRINDMVRIYAEMESLNVIPHTAIFAPMIQAFASTGDLQSAVECYEEYKSLAIAHDQGLKTINRRDHDVYAALVKAYSVCGQMSDGLKFFGKIQDALQSASNLPLIKDSVALQALIPDWIAQNKYEEAFAHASQQVTTSSQLETYGLICEDAADKGDLEAACEAYDRMAAFGPSSTIAVSGLSLLAGCLRSQEFDLARKIWLNMSNLQADVPSIEPSVMYAVAFMNKEEVASALSDARQKFARIRADSNAQEKAYAAERIEEAINVIGQTLLRHSPMPSVAASMEILQMMSENGTITAGLAEFLLAPVGPEQVRGLNDETLNSLLQVQSSLLLNKPQLEIGHVDRLRDLVQLVVAKRTQINAQASDMIYKALTRVCGPEEASRWQQFQHSPVASFRAPMPSAQVYSPQATNTSSGHDGNYDPYASSTDFKGSNTIVEELEKPYGRHSAHLNEALVKFKNMRRAGRHPRYGTYAKLINAAAKENRFGLAQDILAMAKQDVPLIAQNRVVMHGWTSILDAMVGACLTTGRRDMADQFHRELLSMGAAPSANTFGLYITTLKESTKTFDEATEAVQIFHRAQTEGVEPTSFLYNALIGKLGKARRIDDCLFYFAEMRKLGIRPTSVTYGTIVNALCRVSDDKFAEELFEEMESMPNYKPRPAPYNSLMQYFLTTKRDRSKVLSYYNRMRAGNIQPTMHTYKLLVDTHATLEPIDMAAAEAVLGDIRKSGAEPEAVHYASLIHAKGCVLHDLAGARSTFDTVMAEGHIPPQSSLYQAMFESMVANHEVAATEPLLQQMASQGVALTPYIANTLIHGWALAKNITKARKVYDTLGMAKREPSTYEAMTRAYLAVEDHGNAMGVVGEALRRGYPAAVANKICDLVGGGSVKN